MLWSTRRSFRCAANRAAAARRQMPLARSVLAQMWSGPGADVERSWRRCGGSPGPDSAVPVPPSAVPVQSRAVPLHLLRCRPRSSASDATLAFIHMPIASQRMSLGVAPTGATPPATPPVSAAHGGGGLAGPLPVRGVRRRRSPCRRRQPRGSRTVAALPPPLPAGALDAPHAPEPACLAACRAIAAHALPRVIVRAEDRVWPHAERMLLALMRSREGARVLAPLIRLQTLSIGRADAPDCCASSAEAALRATRLLCTVES